MARTQILGMCSLWHWPWRYDLRSSSWHTLGSWTTIVLSFIQIQFCSEELWIGHWFWVCVHCDPWPLRYDLGTKSWHTLGSWTAIVWNIIQIRQVGKKLLPGHDVNRRTDRQTGLFSISPSFQFCLYTSYKKSLFWNCGGIIIERCSENKWSTVLRFHAKIQIFNCEYWFHDREKLKDGKLSIYLNRWFWTLPPDWRQSRL